MRRAKIACTLGSTTDSPEQVRMPVDASMNITRINRSHDRAEDQEEVIGRICEAAAASGRAVAILVDPQNPKIRLGRFVDGQKVTLDRGDELTITVDDVLGTVKRASTTFKGFPGNCRPGDRLLADDSNVAVRVVAVTDTDAATEVEAPGHVSNNKGINLPGVAAPVSVLSEKDREDLRWALKIDADPIALSFVRDADDTEDVHEIMDEVGVHILVTAKIEKPQVVENPFDIVSTFDGVMVARGDLGAEMPLEAVPLAQKCAIELARRRTKPVTVATQAPESMIQNPRPTRAEAFDCVNAILDGVDAVMLSGETFVGVYPIGVVRITASIIKNVEEHGGERIPDLGSYPQTCGGALTRAVAEMGEYFDVTHLVTFIQSGDTARHLSRLYSPPPLLVFTPLHETCNQLAVSWGVQCYEVPEVQHADETVAQVDEILQGKYLTRPGDTVVIVVEMSPGTPGSTNSIHVHTAGETGDYKA